MVAAYPQILARTNCPSCNARLRIRAHLPDGSPVRCSGCRTSFRYFAVEPPTTLSGNTLRKKELDCPKCSLHFVATISGEKKATCPGCAARISFRRSRKTRLTVPAAAVPAFAASSDSRKKSAREALAKSTQFEVEQGPKQVAAVTGNNKGWIAEEETVQPRPAGNSRRIANPVQPPTPPSARRTPGKDSVNTMHVAIAAVLLALVAGYPACSYFFGEVKRETIKGYVTSQGKPVVVGSVVVQGEDGISITGPIAQDGSYAVAGVPRGRVRLAVHSADPSLSQAQPGASDFAPADVVNNQGWFPLPDGSNDTNRSGLTVIVNGETTFNIDLK